MVFNWGQLLTKILTMEIILLTKILTMEIVGVTKRRIRLDNDYLLGFNKHIRRSVIYLWIIYACYPYSRSPKQPSTAYLFSSSFSLPQYTKIYFFTRFLKSELQLLQIHARPGFCLIWCLPTVLMKACIMIVLLHRKACFSYKPHIMPTFIKQAGNWRFDSWIGFLYNSHRWAWEAI